MTDAAAPRADDNPFVGPHPLEEKDGLYGRDRDVAKVLDLVISQRIALVYSPSGAGKTSLLQAGLVPRLEEEFTVRPVVRVGADARADDQQNVNRYLASVASCLGFDVSSGGDPARDRRWLASHLEGIRSKEDTEDGSSEVLIFDQFEELLTLDPSDGAAKHLFMAQVGEALRDRRRWAVFSMREEYIAGLDPYLRLIPTRLAATYRLDFLQQDAARAAIQGPARTRGVAFQDEAANALIDNLRRVQVAQPDGGRTVALGRYIEPVHLQVVCQRLWNRIQPGGREDPEIRESDIAELGDLDEELGRYYEDEVEAAAEATKTPERKIRDWFDDKLLVGGFRNQVLAANGAISAALLKRLEDVHLVRRDAQRGALWVELAHDRLIEPIRRSNAAWRLSRLSVLQQQAELWRAQGKPDGMLLSGEVLVDEERKVLDHELSELDTEFLDACREQQDALEREQRTTRRLRRLTVCLLAVSLVAGVVAIGFYQSKKDLKAQEVRSTNQVLAFHVFSKLGERLDRSLLLDVEAGRGNDAPEARSALLSDLVRSPQLTTFLHSPIAAISVAVRPGGRIVAAGGDDGTIRLWDTDRPREATPLKAQTELVGGLAFSPDGRMLASASDDATVVLWDVERRQPAATLRADHGKVTSVAFSPDGATLAAGQFDGSVVLWDVPGRRQVATLEGHQNVVTSVAFSGDGVLASGSDDRTVVLWDLAGRTLLARLMAHTGAVRSVAFSGDGRLLASGANDGTVILWDTASRQAVRPPLAGHRGFVRSVAFSPDGATLASGSEDSTVILWDVKTGEGRPLAGHGDFVTGVAFTSDGGRLASSSIDHSVILWDTHARVPFGASHSGHRGPATSVAFSGDGRTMASGSEDGTVILRDGDSRQIVATLAGHDGAVTGVAISPDGTTVASGGEDGSVILWDVRSHQRIASLDGHATGVRTVAFSPDGGTLASGGDDSAVILWDARNHQRVASLQGHRGPVRSVAYAPDGKKLVSGSDDGTIAVWGAAAHDRTATLEGQSGQVRSVAFSPDGATLASANENGTVVLWDAKRFVRADHAPLAGQSGSLTGVAWSDDRILASSSDDGTVVLWDTQWMTTGHPSLGHPLTAHQGPVDGVAFGGAPRGRRVLAAAGNDATVVVWDADPATWIAHACAIANRDLESFEWDQFIGRGRAQRRTCP